MRIFLKIAKIFNRKKMENYSYLISVKLNLLLILFVFHSNTYSQTYVEGIVMDNINGVPIVGANIVVNGTKNNTQSNTDGSFKILINQKLPVKITSTLVGYELKEVEIDKPSNNLMISMIPGVLVGQEQIVSASRKVEKIQEASSAIELVEAEELLHDVVLNPFLSLRNKGGLDILQTGVSGGHITLRGRSTVFQTETFVMADYRNLKMPGLGTLTYEQQPFDAIDLEKIEIVKGPGTVVYYPGVETGTVHFISKSPFAKQGTTVSVGTGTQGTFQASLRHAGLLASGKLGYKLVGFYRKAQDWAIDSTDVSEASHLRSFQPQVVSRLTGDFITREIPDYDMESYGFTGTLEFQANDQTTVTATGGWSVGKSLFRTTQGEGYTSAPRPFGQVRVQSENLFAQAIWSYHGGTDGKSFLYTTGLTTITQSHQLEGQVQYNFNLVKERLNLVVGGDYRLNTFDTKRTGHGRWENEDNYTIYGAYAQAEFKLNKSLDFVAATRLDRYVALKEFSISPRLGVVFKPSQKHTFRATFNRAVGAPTAFNLFADLPLANQGAFLVHLIGGVEDLSFNQPQTTSFLPGVGASEGIGVDLQKAYSFFTRQLEEEGIISGEIMDYLLSMQNRIEGFSQGVMTQAPRARGKLKLSSSQMFEIGYKGSFENKLEVSVDLYYNKRKNVVSPPFQASPFVVQPTLGQDLSEAILNGLDFETLEGMGLSPMAITNLYAGFANAVSVDDETGQLNPLGLVRSDQTPFNSPLPTLDISYYNISEIDYFGLDLALDYHLLGDIFLYGSLSWLSEAYFEDVSVGEEENSATTDFSLNVPSLKIKLGAEYRPEIGFNGFLMVRHQNAWRSRNGTPWTGPVDAFFVVDLGLGYTFNKRLRINSTLTNVFAEDYRAIYGAPKIGRQFMVRLYYDF